MRLFLTLTLIIAATLPALARPVSYPGGWTLILQNDIDTNSALLHYSPTATYSIGLRHEYLRQPGANADTAQLNYLLKRWNGDASQANAYIKSGFGVAYDSDQIEPIAFTGFTLDWENRRYSTSYENRFFTAGEITQYVKHEARIGIAPYIGDYGDIHTWLILQADYDAGEQDSFSATPLIRLFKGPDRLEAGYNLDNGVLLNYTHRF